MELPGPVEAEKPGIRLADRSLLQFTIRIGERRGAARLLVAATTCSFSQSGGSATAAVSGTNTSSNRYDA